MKAVFRLAMVALAAGFGLGPLPALAPAAAQDTANTPAADAIGPRELQNFSLPGTVTRQAEPAPAQRTPAAPQPSPATAAPERLRSADRAAQETQTPSTTPTRSAARGESREAVQREDIGSAPATAPAAELAATAPSSSVTVDLPPARPAASASGAAAAAAAFAAESDSAPISLAPSQSLPLWPWFLAALALGAGGGFLLWRRNGREALAGGPRFEGFQPPQPPPAAPPVPRAAPPLPKGPAALPAGIVSTRLRPWLDIGIEPARCIVEESAVIFEFELALFNSGSLPASDVLFTSGMINASGTQEQDIAAFFARTPASQPIVQIDPLSRVPLPMRLTVALDRLRILEAGGRRLFVPLIVVNAVYRWGSNKGQTASAYLVGRDTGAEKFAPLRLDLGPRIFRGLGARPLDQSIRT